MGIHRLNLWILNEDLMEPLYERKRKKERKNSSLTSASTQLGKLHKKKKKKKCFDYFGVF